MNKVQQSIVQDNYISKHPELYNIMKQRCEEMLKIKTIEFHDKLDDNNLTVVGSDSGNMYFKTGVGEITKEEFLKIMEGKTIEYEEREDS
jgi:hypothetical protein